MKWSRRPRNRTHCSESSHSLHKMSFIDWYITHWSRQNSYRRQLHFRAYFHASCFFRRCELSRDFRQSLLPLQPSIFLLQMLFFSSHFIRFLFRLHFNRLRYQLLQRYWHRWEIEIDISLLSSIFSRCIFIFHIARLRQYSLRSQKSSFSSLLFVA